MHPTAYNSCKRFYDCYGKYFDNPKVADVGSYDVNGTVKDIFSNCDYLGIDIADGPNVDLVLKEPYKYPFEDNTFDIVVSTSCFEHNEMFWVTFLETMRILKPQGIFYLNAPSNGGFHRCPVDCWRFWPDAGHALVTWAKYNNLNVALLESYIAHDENGGNDFVAVFVKDESYAQKMPDRIIKNYSDYYNGKKYGTDQIFNNHHMLNKIVEK